MPADSSPPPAANRTVASPAERGLNECAHAGRIALGEGANLLKTPRKVAGEFLLGRRKVQGQSRDHRKAFGRWLGG
jgi:hypothetical protein